ncbi:hypothetical protein GOP47_0014329 [Adiantum capillus-veneris]|uniref:F-box/LRR-repeat protein 15-like leucin rich repeat domain-containing protein n=1 Tax=Adiantum capillus-veneris TaxID=13818 RepID=A0A9D4ZER7_ADICA|nr:hypothetical protein GOP47_0014329 [Adiantum capillus-veneris]
MEASEIFENEDFLWRLVRHLPENSDRNRFSLVCQRFRRALLPFRTKFLFNCERYETGDKVIYLQFDPEKPEVEVTPIEWTGLLPMLQACAQTFPTIVSLSIMGLWSGSSSLPTNGLSSVLLHPRFAHLSSLKISFFKAGVDDNFVRLISTACCNLTYLNLRHCCPRLSDQALHSLAGGCTRLQFLKLRGHDRGPNTISDFGIERLLSSCTRLTDLRLCVGFNQVTGWGVRAGHALTCVVMENLNHLESNALSQGLQGKRLKRLSLHGAARLGEIERLVVERCAAEVVEELNLSGRMELKDGGLERIARECRRLRVLELRGVHGVTEEGWKALARHAEALEDLDVRDCYFFREDCLRALRENCQNLRHLLISSYFFLQQRSLETFCNARPSVTVKVYHREKDYVVDERVGLSGRPLGSRLGRRPTLYKDPVRCYKVRRFGYPWFEFLPFELVSLGIV